MQIVDTIQKYEDRNWNHTNEVPSHNVENQNGQSNKWTHESSTELFNKMNRNKPATFIWEARVQMKTKRGRLNQT